MSVRESRIENRVSLVVTALASTYTTWAALLMTRRVQAFAALFESLGAELPHSTRLAMAVSRPGIVFPAAAILIGGLIVAHFRIVHPIVRIGVSMAVFMVAAIVVSLVTEALFLPMLHLIRQLG
jgi:hypothetical protein